MSKFEFNDPMLQVRHGKSSKLETRIAIVVGCFASVLCQEHKGSDVMVLQLEIVQACGPGKSCSIRTT